jgi:uncharacterized coiled-coil DUF342 family protein
LRVFLLSGDSTSLFDRAKRTRMGKVTLKAILSEIKKTNLRVVRSEREMIRRFDQIDQRFEQVDERFEQVDKRFEQSEAKVDDHFQLTKQEFQVVHSDIGKIFSEIDGIHSKVGAMNTKIEEVDTKVSGIHSEFRSEFRVVYHRFDRIDRTLELIATQTLKTVNDVADHEHRLKKLEAHDA